MISKMIRSLLQVLMIVHCIHLASSCPSVCECDTQRRIKRVKCSGGFLASIIPALPQNTAYLTLDSITSLNILQQADFEQAPSSILRLAVTNSAVQKLGESVFPATLTSLQDLDLSRNSIRTLDSNAFAGLSSLRTLNLSSNRLDMLGSALQPLVSLQTLDLGHNFIDDLPSSTLQAQTSLSYLSLDGNHFRSLSGGIFQALQFLSELRVRGCGIFFISEDFFSSITRVSLLDLGDNRLSSFPSSTAFSELQQLKRLYLDGNELLQLHPSQFADLSLLTLSLARNRISGIPPRAFSGLTVEELDLSENKLLELKGESLQPVALHLATLNLANNPIRVLHPDTFSGLRLLETLNLSACSLTNLPPDTFTGLYSLRRLDVSWNNLQNISEDMVKVLNRLSMINLYHNSWNCDCHITPFRDWLRSRNSIQKLSCHPGQGLDDCSDLTCSSPDGMLGNLVSNLLDADLEQCSAAAKSGLPVPIQISIVLACLLFSLGMLLLTLYLWRRGRTRKELKKLFQKRKPEGRVEVEDEEDDKIAPFVDCDNESLKESHRSFVFRHYFDQMVTDPKLLEPPSPSQVEPEPEPVQQGAHPQKDSVYSSDPALYEASHNSHSIVVGIESTV